MPKLKVTNKSKKTVSRLGYNFEPNKTQEIEVSNREQLTVTAVRALETEVIEESGEEQSGEEETGQDDEEELKKKVQNSTIDGVIEMVENGEVTATQAIAYEQDGKNRSTLIEKLEEYDSNPEV